MIKDEPVRWKQAHDFEKLTLYLCGGGSLIGGTVVHSVPWCKEIRAVWEQDTLYAPTISPRFMEAKAPFLRMAFAYGLSLDPTYFWGDFRLPSGVPDHEIEIRQNPDWMIINDGNSVGAMG